MFAIETRALTKRYGKSEDAVHAVSLAIPRGELFGLFGPNGAGKSTLIRMLTTLLAPTSGGARVNGFDIVTQADAVRASVGLVFSNEHSFYGRLSGRQNLNFFAALQNLSPRETRVRVDELLEMFALEPYANAMFQAYSTGMRQKLNVARALLHNPPVLFLDEPTKGMDVPTADAVRALLKDEIVGRQGKTVFLTTHDLYEMDYLCDRIGVLARGELQAFGRPRELLERMQRERVFEIELTHALENLTPRLARVPGIELKQVNGIRIEFAADEQIFSEQELLSEIYAAGGRIRRYAPKDEGLRTLLRRAAGDEPLA
jgi:ABC-2 type transport system ATP-binding protein